jgi:hypothetical protein
MKHFFIILALAIFLFSCDNNGMNEEDKGLFSLIGTWEAEGEFMVGADQRTYKSTLIFTETEYTQESRFKSKQGAFDWTSKNEGTYIREDEKIIYTDYDISDGGRIGPYIKPIPYKFVNKNTLETLGPGITGSSAYIQGVSFKRK